MVEQFKSTCKNRTLSFYHTLQIHMYITFYVSWHFYLVKPQCSITMNVECTLYVSIKI